MKPGAVNAAAKLTAARFASFSDATQAVLEMLEAQLPGSAVFVGHFDDDQDRFRIIDARGDTSFDLEAGATVDLNDSFCIRMAAGEAPSLTGDAAADPVYGKLAVQDELDIKSYAGVPLELAGGARIGSLCAITHDLGAYDESDLQLLQVLANLLAFQLERDRTQRELEALTIQLREQATTDHLTGLLNRRTFDESLEREWALTGRDGVPSYLVLFDLDHFKELNDTRGHAAGDEVLKGFADALRGATRKTDSVARIGGDEFAVVLVRALVSGAPATLVDRVCHALRQTENGPLRTLETSAGWVPLGDADSPEAAFQVADEAMYAAKRAR